MIVILSVSPVLYHAYRRESSVCNTSLQYHQHSLVTQGVPQGSILRLFITFNNDLPLHLTSDIYADDLSV